MTVMYVYNVSTGKMLPVPVSDESEDKYADCRNEVSIRGFSTDGANDIIISEGKLADWPRSTSDRKPLVLRSEEERVALPLPTPPIPEPTSPTNFPPEVSEKLVVSTDPISTAQFLFAGSHWIPAWPHLPSGLSDPVPALPSYIALQFSTYWRQRCAAVVAGPQTYGKDVQYLTGMSTTNSTTISAELGVAVSGLSAKLTATTGHSVTIESQTSITDRYSIPVPSDVVTVYVLWELMEQFLFVDADGDPISYNGTVKFAVTRLPLTFPNTPVVNNTNTVYSVPTDFSP